MYRAQQKFEYKHEIIVTVSEKHTIHQEDARNIDLEKNRARNNLNLTRKLVFFPYTSHHLPLCL